MYAASHRDASSSQADYLILLKTGSSWATQRLSVSGLFSQLRSWGPHESARQCALPLFTFCLEGGGGRKARGLSRASLFWGMLLIPHGASLSAKLLNRHCSVSEADWVCSPVCSSAVPISIWVALWHVFILTSFHTGDSGAFSFLSWGLLLHHVQELGAEASVGQALTAEGLGV